MADHGIFNETEKYWITRDFWLNKDLLAYTLGTDRKDRNFTSLKAFLIKKAGVLLQGRVSKKLDTWKNLKFDNLG